MRPRAAIGDVPLATRGPFHLEATVRVLQRRPTNMVDVWEEGQRPRYLRALATTDGVALVEVTNQGTIDDPDLRLSVLGGAPSATVRAVIGRTMRQILGLDVDPAPLQRAVEAQRRLDLVAQALRGMRPPRFAGLFEAFANVVPFQQLSLDAGVATVGRLVERFGDTIEHAGRRIHAVPDARAVAEARMNALRACGLIQSSAPCVGRIRRAGSRGARIGLSTTL